MSDSSMPAESDDAAVPNAGGVRDTRLPHHPHAEGYRNTRRLATGAIVTTGLLALVEVVEGVAAWSAEAYAQADRDRFAAGTAFAVYDLALTMWLPLAVAAYVANCMWLWSVRHNAEVLGTHGQTHPRPWVWTSWLVPIVNLWLPFQLVRDVRRATREQSDNFLLRCWWAGWLVMLIARVGASLESPTSIPAAAETVGAFFAVGTSVLWAQVVLRIGNEQETVVIGPAGAAA